MNDFNGINLLELMFINSEEDMMSYVSGPINKVDKHHSYFIFQKNVSEFY